LKALRVVRRVICIFTQEASAQHPLHIGFQRTTKQEVVPSSGEKSNNFTGYWSREQTVQGRNHSQQLTSKDRRKLEIDQQSCDRLFCRYHLDPRFNILKQQKKNSLESLKNIQA